MAGNSTINMTNGEAKMRDFIAKNTFTHVDNNNIKRTKLFHNATSGTSLEFYKADGNKQIALWADPTYGGVMRFYNPSNYNTVTLSTGSDGGQLDLYGSTGTTYISLFPSTGGGGNIKVNNGVGTSNFSVFTSAYGGNVNVSNSMGNIVASMFTGSAYQGEVYIYDGSSTGTVFLHGGNGNITCVSLTQTSSRKVKDNIKPIEDANKILELDAVSFDYKNKAQGTNKRGFIAEDVAEIIPNLVTPETEDGAPATLDYIGMIPYLQDVIKNQEKRIKVLEEKINKLGG